MSILDFSKVPDLSRSQISKYRRRRCPSIAYKSSLSLVRVSDVYGVLLKPERGILLKDSETFCLVCSSLVSKMTHPGFQSWPTSVYFFLTTCYFFRSCSYCSKKWVMQRWKYLGWQPRTSASQSGRELQRRTCRSMPKRPCLCLTRGKSTWREKSKAKMAPASPWRL